MNNKLLQEKKQNLLLLITIFVLLQLSLQEIPPIQLHLPETFIAKSLEERTCMLGCNGNLPKVEESPTNEVMYKISKSAFRTFLLVLSINIICPLIILIIYAILKIKIISIQNQLTYCSAFHHYFNKMLNFWTGVALVISP